MDIVRVVNQQLLNRSILLDKIDRSQGNFEGYAQRAKMQVYVPYANPSDTSVKGYSDLAPTNEVLLAMRTDGSIGGLVSGGYVSATVIDSSLVSTPTLTASSVIGYHPVADAVNSVATANATDLATSEALANALKVAFNAHRTQATVHSANDAVNVVATANASDLATTIALANALKTAFNAHRTQANVHYKNDSNAVATANAADLATAQTLLNAIKAAFNIHIAAKAQLSLTGTVFVSVTPDVTYVSVTNPSGVVQTVASTSFDSLAATAILIPVTAVTGTMTTGWEISVMANSKLTSTFTLA